MIDIQSCGVGRVSDVPSDDSDFVSDDALWSALDQAEGAERASILRELGERSYNRGDVDESVALLESAAQGFRDAGIDGEAAESLYWFGQCLRRLERTDEAIATLREASDLFREVGDQGQLGACHDAIGRVLVEAGQEDAALAEFDSAERLYLAGDDLESAGRAAMNRGETLGRLNRQAEALSVFRSARELFRKAHDAFLSSWADDRAAAALIDLGQVGEAIELLRGCQHVMQNSSRAGDRAYAAYRLGWTLRIRDHFDEAVPFLEIAHHEYADEGDFRGMASCDLEAAHCLAAQDSYEESERLYAKARAMFDAVGDDFSVVLSDSGRAQSLRDRGERETALQIQQGALIRAREVGQTWLASGIVTRIADDLLHLGRESEALQLLDEEVNADAHFGDETHEKNFRRYVLAAAALANGDIARAGAISEEGIADLSGTDDINRLADMHKVHSSVVREDDDEAANRELAYAVALYLAAGEHEKATELSSRFLRPEPVGSRRIRRDSITERPGPPSSSQDELRDSIN
jgi:tetratricopeptide (TPR) repeat protein